MSQMVVSRVLEVEVTHNTRHLGGYRGADGCATSDRIVRSAGLQRLTPGGIERLAEFGVRTVVDLRSTVERERDVTPDLSGYGITTVAVPVFEQDASPPGLGEEFAGYAPVYRSMLESGGEAYRKLFETIAGTNDAVLFHCAAGKDRTGVASALLLDLAGVADEDILSDYALSEELLSPVLSTWLPRMQERGIDEERARGLLAARPEAMAETLAFLRERWGSSEGYLLSIGIERAKVEDLRAKIVA